jgi:hypothetical protein
MSNVNSALPQANVSLSLLDSSSDDIASAFLKYNRHQHNPIIVPSFTAYDISVGSPVYIYSQDGTELFEGSDDAVVTYLSSKKLTISKSATSNVANGILYYGQTRDGGGKAILGVDIEDSSQTVEFHSTVSYYDYSGSLRKGRGGFITPIQLQALQKHTVSVFLTLNFDIPYYCLIPRLDVKAWLRGVSYYSYDFTSSIHIARYSSSEAGHNISDSSTWTRVSPSFTPTVLTPGYVDCLAEDLPDGSSTYPSDYATSCCKEGDMLAFVFEDNNWNSNQTSQFIQIVLHFDKVID